MLCYGDGRLSGALERRRMVPGVVVLHSCTAAAVVVVAPRSGLCQASRNSGTLPSFFFFLLTSSVKRALLARRYLIYDDPLWAYFTGMVLPGDGLVYFVRIIEVTGR